MIIKLNVIFEWIKVRPFSEKITSFGQRISLITVGSDCFKRYNRMLFFFFKLYHSLITKY
ncbi:hypothetical protein EM308_09975 [Flavobacterium gilvum]|uniref:Uncharacterized protein n=1 Tax=Flavobacterium gilvum TaxID=1492737 RepID=A0AAC9N5I9_9FLAO|nr:hypothetical protein EM308_09975 [Flavobacterium gilvum]KFC58107.1 hypothetical protein FEM08_31750 [Flavobacterium gilvum]